MHARKFYFTLTNIILVFLFISGLVILGFMGSSKAAGSFLGDDFMKDLYSKNEPVNILVLGGDKTSGNTDTMMIANYNPSTAKISILSIPRDTMVKIDGNTRKINFAYPHGGIDLAIKTIEDLINININYYVYIDISVFRDVIDELGGVVIDIPADMKYDDPTQNLHINLKKGQRKLNGAEAEGFMRFRHPNQFKKSDTELKKYYDGSDLKRIDAQQNFIKALIKQKANILYLPRFNTIINMVFDRINTNITSSEALKLSNNITNIKVDEVTTFKLLGEDKRISGGWYYLYGGKILNNNTGEESDADVILEQYFNSEGGFSDYKNITKPGDEASDSKEDASKKSSAPKSGTKSSTSKKNPSNAESSIKGTKKPGP